MLGDVGIAFFFNWQTVETLNIPELSAGDFPSRGLAGSPNPVIGGETKLMCWAAPMTQQRGSKASVRKTSEWLVGFLKLDARFGAFHGVCPNRDRCNRAG